MLGVFSNEFKAVTVKSTADGAYIDGEWTEGASNPDQTVDMVPIPITPAQLKNLPEGQYAAGDMKFYAKGAAVYTAGTIFIYKGVSFKVRDINDRSDHGGFTVYFGRREVSQ